jgi:hypothetical protein
MNALRARRFPSTARVSTRTPRSSGFRFEYARAASCIPVKSEQKGKVFVWQTHPTTECFERVHGLFVARAVFVQLGRARSARGRGWERVERRMRVVLAVALHVADLLVEFEIVGLEAPDLGS